MKKKVIVVGCDGCNSILVQSALEGEYDVSFFKTIDCLNDIVGNVVIDALVVDVEGLGRDNIFNKLDRGKIGFRVPIILVVDQMYLKTGIKEIEELGAEIILKPLVPAVVRNRVKTQISLSVFKIDMGAALREKTEVIENLQDVMLMSIAELVECRDRTTGGHVKRTAKYVDILVRELVKRKVYEDVLVDRYVKDMIRSAPLHDVGKIGISDSTLLKNGSLDEEEFEFMKTHSSLGGLAIQRMIDQTTSGSFLDVAKDMAQYHHEKWDGTGYPDGLKGDEIPVSARIMAIADVYDALTTERPYKKAFSHEQAMEIIYKGKGTAYDPKIIEVFEHISEEFRCVKNKE